MGEEDRWAKLEEIVRRVVREEIAVLGKKGKLDFVNGRWVGITQEQKEAWAAAYGAVEIEDELKKAAAWAVSNPHLAPKSQFGRFLNTWLARTQNQSSIRSIPTRSEMKPNLCAYCGLPATGAVNGYRHCERHFASALDHEPPAKFMAGVVAKPVSGS